MQPLITSITYNWNGSEKLASNFNEGVLLFDANCEKSGNDTETSKFMGKYSEFIVDENEVIEDSVQM